MIEVDMRVVKPVGGDFTGEVRCGKRLVAVEQADGYWQADADGAFGCPDERWLCCR